MFRSLATGTKRLIGALAMVAALAGCGGGDDPVADALLRVDAWGATRFDTTALAAELATLPVETLGPEEESGLLFMREEEKLARDVYQVLFGIWAQQVFDNIAAAEQSHMDAVALLLDRYTLDDPVGDNGVGEFTDPGLQGLYDSLVAQGGTSLVDALLVGAAIEEIDIVDLQNQLDGIVDNQDITLVYENLMMGSRNHLRAFVDNLARQGITYEPQYLSQEEYEAIINPATI